MPLPRRTPFARGHTGRILLGRRVVIPGDFSDRRDRAGRRLRQHRGGCRALLRAAVAAGATQRAVGRKPARNDRAANGAIRIRRPSSTMASAPSAGSLDGWDWFGHSGGLQGYISRTCVLPQQDLTISRAHQRDRRLGRRLGRRHHARPAGLRAQRRTDAQGAETGPAAGGACGARPISSRWATRCMLAAPGFVNPLTDAQRSSTITGRTAGRISAAAGFGSHGEPVRCVRAKSGRITEICSSPRTQFLPADKVAREMEARYDAPKPRKRRGRKGRR